jgi:FkbM family methyltransferase
LATRLDFLKGLRYNIPAAIEHIQVLKLIDNPNTFIDIGANKGQFSLAARHAYSDAAIISFEPLSGPAEIFKKVFTKDQNIVLHQSAIGPQKDTVEMHVSNREDSSSLLPIGNKQSSMFPGTEESHNEEIKVAPLNHFLSKKDLTKPVFVKIDVQGYELEVLKGSKNLIDEFDYIYVECSFVELYEGQALADEVIAYLANYSFKLKGVYNTFYDKKGIAVQADLLFSKR